MANGLDILAVKRVNAFMRELRDVREIPQSLRFLERTTVREATDGEILAKWRGNVLISDIIFEGSRAITKNTDQFTTETYKIPKIKHGVLIDEEMIVMLRRMAAQGGLPGDEGILSNYVNRKLDDTLLGIRQRQNAMIVAMWLDAFSYSRGGIVISGANWGVPAAFKSTPAVPWTTAASATPITDISTQRQNDLELYGEVRNRITLSSADLRLIFATTEFKDKAQLYSQMTFPTGTFPLTAELGTQTRILQAILDGMVIETEDSRYSDQNPDGSIYSTPYWPLGKVVLSNTADDNNASAAYLGNAIVPESTVSSLADVGGVVGSFSGPEFGPVAYTVASFGLNPPDLTIWGVAKCWPVRVRPGLTSILTVR